MRLFISQIRFTAATKLSQTESQTMFSLQMTIDDQLLVTGGTKKNGQTKMIQFNHLSNIIIAYMNLKINAEHATRKRKKQSAPYFVHFVQCLKEAKCVCMNLGVL